MLKYIRKNRGVITGALIAIVGCTIAIMIGFVLINTMAERVSQIPVNGFTVIDKEQKQQSFWMWHWTEYYFKYGNKTADWVQVPTYLEYSNYNIGDWCNETNLWVFNS
jgi:hypothetical protein